MHHELHIRRAVEDDLESLAAIYAHAVGTLSPKRYSQDQVRAWLLFAQEVQLFRDFVLIPTTFVAEDATGPLGFAGVADDGHVASLYVHGDRGRQGIGSALLQTVFDHAKERGIPRLYTEASEFSKPLFERFDFRVLEKEVVERHGVEFSRYRMERIGKSTAD